MIRSVWRALVAASLLVSLLPAPARAQVGDRQPVDYVDPMIGTLGSGFVFPGPAAPFGMVQLSPDTDGYFAYTGYLYSDQFIRGFSHHHIESKGVRSNGDLPFMPTVGPIASTDPRAYMSKFSHATEEAEPGYYSVILERYGIAAELTAGTRVGMHRYAFPPTAQANVLFDVGRSNAGWDPFQPRTHVGSIEIVGDQTVLGTADSPQGYDIHFAARFDRPFDGFGAWDAPNAVAEDVREASGNGAGGYVSFDTTDGDLDVQIKVGVSFVDRENALENLEAETGTGFPFDEMRDQTRSAWNEALKTITVAGGTEADKASFYTALYHAQHHPNVYEDANGEYMGHDKQVHDSDGYTHYANFSLWDTYRGENQLLATIQPQRYRDMMRSLLKIYEQQGRFPQWAMNDVSPDYMVGDPVQPTIVDGYCRGLLDGAEAAEMYAALRRQAFEPSLRSATQGDYPSYEEKGYLPNKTSETLEYALADFSLALMADSLGETEDRDALLRRAGNYRNVINPASGFAQPRNADGTWATPYSPEEPDRFIEGTGWQYTWLAPHDLRGLFDIIGRDRGGDQLVQDRLDTFFSTTASDIPGAVAEAQQKITLFGIVYAGNQYAPSNEHDLHAPYLYDYAEAPWKTQKIMRGYQALYRPTPDGLPGNDDLGSMSAWYLWSALGFYPVTAGAPVYVVGSPVFEEATITPVGAEESVSVRAPGASLLGRYIQSARLGGQDLDRPWFTHDELFDSGVTFSMGPVPNEEWGADPKAAPPSMSSVLLKTFGCPGRSLEPSVIEYVGDIRARGETVLLAARLVTPDGAPIVGRELTFEIAGQSASDATDASGTASVTVSVPDHGRSQEVIVSFKGDDSFEASRLTTVISWGGIPKP